MGVGVEGMEWRPETGVWGRRPLGTSTVYESTWWSGSEPPVGSDTGVSGTTGTDSDRTCVGSGP